nr:MAG TPA: hypothetical protein [Caudoviricetes sp.]
MLYGLRFARPPYTIHIDSLRQSHSLVLVSLALPLRFFI